MKSAGLVAVRVAVSTEVDDTTVRMLMKEVVGDVVIEQMAVVVEVGLTEPLAGTEEGNGMNEETGVTETTGQIEVTNFTIEESDRKKIGRTEIAMNAETETVIEIVSVFVTAAEKGMITRMTHIRGKITVT